MQPVSQGISWGFAKEADLLHYAPSSQSWALSGWPPQSSPRLRCSAPRWEGCRCCCCPARCWCADAPTGSPPGKLQGEKAGKAANIYISLDVKIRRGGGKRVEKFFSVKVAITYIFYKIIIILARVHWAALHPASTSWVSIITWLLGSLLL